MVERRLTLPVILLAGLASAAAQSRPLTLDNAIDLALQGNRAIVEAKKDTAHYEQMKARARAEYFPLVHNASEVTYITNREGIVLPSTLLGGGPPTSGAASPKTVRIDQGATENYISQTEAIQPLTQLFAVHASNRMAQADIQRSFADQQNTRLETVASVHRQFYSVLIAREQLASSQASLLAAQEATHEQESMWREGNTLRAELLRARAQQRQAEAAIITARSQVHDGVVQLIVLLSLPAATPTDPQLPPEASDALPPLPTRAEALTIALANEPRLLATRQTVEKARAAVRLAESAYIPGISAVARENYQSGVAFLTHNYGTFSGQVNILLFDGGRRRAEVNDAKILLDKAQIALEGQQEQTRASVEVTFDQVDEAVADLAAKRLASDAAAEAEREAMSRFSNGEILPSQRDSVSAVRAASQAALLESRLNLALARVQVARVLGQIPR